MDNTIQARFYNQLLEKYLQLKSMNPRETKEVSAKKLGISQQYLNKIFRETGNAGLIQSRTVHKVLDSDGNVVTDKEEKKYWRKINNERKQLEAVVESEGQKKKSKKILAGTKDEMRALATN